MRSHQNFRSFKRWQSTRATILLPSIVLSLGLATVSTEGRSTAMDITSLSERGFEIELAVTCEGEPEEVFKRFTDDVGSWWSADHTYSGDAKNLAIESRPGGRFWERFPDGGGVEHLRVVMVQPGKTLRMSGGIGPLQEFAVSGSLTVIFEEGEDQKTKVRVKYVVGGYSHEGLTRWGIPVDEVLKEQLERFQNWCAKQTKTD